MAAIGSIDKLDVLQSVEFNRYQALHSTPEAQKLATAQKEILETFKAIHRSGNIRDIVAAETLTLENEFARYLDSPTQRKSIENAIQEMGIVRKLLPIVEKPEEYQRLAELSHQRASNRKGAVPNDEARQSLNGHSTRLNNVDKSRMTPTERVIVKQRRANMKLALSLYDAKQRQSLGLEPKANNQTQSNIQRQG